MIVTVICLLGTANAIEWNVEELVVQQSVQADNDLVFDDEGNMHMCFHYKSGVIPGSDLYYGFKAAGATDWTITPVDVDTQNWVGANCDIALDSQGNPHISYEICDDQDWSYAKYAYFDGTNWNIMQLTYSPNHLDHGTSIAMIGDVPHIFISQYSPGLLHVWKTSPSAWDSEVVQAGYPTVHPSAKVDPSGNIGVAYFHQGAVGPMAVKYAYKDGASWQVETAYNEILSNDYYELDLDYDLDGHPHIVSDALSTSPTTIYMLLHTWNDGSQWLTDNLLQVENSYGKLCFPSIALDQGNNVHITVGVLPWPTSNSDGTFDGILYHISDESDTWVSTIVMESINPMNTSIAIDPSNQPHIISQSNDYLPYGGLSYIWRTIETGINEESYWVSSADLLGNPGSNPCWSSSSIGYSVPVSGSARLELFDISGRIVDVLADGFHQAGEYETGFSGLTTGVYLFRYTTGNTVETKKLIVL